MAVYEYRCPSCGVFEVERTMGTAAPSDCCVICGSTARRSYSAPNVNRTPRPLANALARAEKSREQPDVVSKVPPQRNATRPRTSDALPTGLPRW